MGIDAERLFKKRKELTKRGRSQLQEESVARRIGGRLTISSGSTPVDKGDVKERTSKLRLEAKHTVNASMKLDKAWLAKIKTQCTVSEIPALNIRIQDEEWYMVRPEEFDFILERIKEERDANMG